MNKKVSNGVKKAFAVGTIVMMCGTSTTYAYTMKTQPAASSISSLFSSFFKKKQNNSYSLDMYKADMENLKMSGVTDMSQITALTDKLPSGDIKNALEGLEGMFSGMLGDSGQLNSSGVLNKLIDVLLKAADALKGGIANLGSLDLGGILGDLIGSGSLKVNPTSIYRDAETAVRIAGQDKAAKLHAYVYEHVDASGKKDSDKWVVLVHPFLLNGKIMAGSLGSYYYDRGYNILAPDLRGFGESEGSVAMGFYEALDVYDWLVKLNQDYAVSQVFVHGMSLGGATTNYLSGIDGLVRDKVRLTSLTDLKVVGLVEDCGYVDMEDFGPKIIIKLFSGLGDNYDAYNSARNSLANCKVPMMIIHGTKDTTVDPSNAATVKEILQKNKIPVDVHMVDGAPHAFAILGQHKDEYRGFINGFLDKYEKATGNAPATNQPQAKPEQKPTETPKEEVKVPETPKQEEPKEEVKVPETPKQEETTVPETPKQPEKDPVVPETPKQEQQSTGSKVLGILKKVFGYFK